MPPERYSDIAKTPGPLPLPPKPPAPAPSIRPLTRADATKGIENFKAKFRKSDRTKHLESLIERGQKAKITRCVCLNLGHFINIDLETRPERRSAGKLNTSLHQLAMLEMLLEGLAAGGDAIEVFFEDNLVTGVERGFLQLRGYTVTMYNAGVYHIPAGTLNFAPCASHQLIARAFKPGDPALYIGTDLDEVIEGISTCETKEALKWKENWAGCLQGFKHDSFQTEDLPIFVDNVDNGVDIWRYGSVYWPSRGNAEIKPADGLGKGDTGKKGKRGNRSAKGADRLRIEDNRSTLPSSSKEKGKEKEIDWWNHEDTSDSKLQEGQEENPLV